MKPAVTGEFYGLALAATIVLIALVIVFISMTLQRGAGGAGAGGFCAGCGDRGGQYAPACGRCGGRCGGRCRGLTGGAMPAIEPTRGFGNGLCCGSFGIPP